MNPSNLKVVIFPVQIPEQHTLTSFIPPMQRDNVKTPLILRPTNFSPSNWGFPGDNLKARPKERNACVFNFLNHLL